MRLASAACRVLFIMRIMRQGRVHDPALLPTNSRIPEVTMAYAAPMQAEEAATVWVLSFSIGTYLPNRQVAGRCRHGSPRPKIQELWARPASVKNISVNHLWKNPPYIGWG